MSSTADEAMNRLCETMRAYGAGPEFELSLGELVGRYRRAHEARMRDAEAARLLPHGAEALADRQHCHRATAYRRAERGRRLSRFLQPSATKP